MDAAEGRSRARALAEAQHGIVSRGQLLAAGVPRWLVRLELRVGRWRRTGARTVAVHNGPLDAAALRAVAVLECGPSAALDGVSALQEHGLASLTDQLVTVIVPKGARYRRRQGTRVRESRRFREDDVLDTGLRCVRPAVAAVHAALWAATDRQATLFLTVAVQGGLASPADLADAATAVRRHVRRRLITRVILDLAGGIRSLGELDVAAAMRRRGLPEPTRQAVRRRPSGTQYLDADFPRYGITLEVDGSQHDLPEHRLSDLVRDLDLAAEHRTVVRIPLVAWRLDEHAVLDGLERLFRARGWAAEAA